MSLVNLNGFSQLLSQVSFGKAFVGALEGDLWPPPRLRLLELNSKYHARHPIEQATLPAECRVLYHRASSSDY